MTFTADKSLPSISSGDLYGPGIRFTDCTWDRLSPDRIKELSVMSRISK